MAATPELLSRLLAPYMAASPGPAELPAGVLTGLADYLELLQRWNARIALTSIKGEGEIVMRHFGESLFAARWLLAEPASKLADLGSGAGFPGLPMALYAAHAGIALATTLIEANGKKAAFLREVARTLQLASVQVQSQRAELASGGGSASYDLVTMRAVERFDEALPVAVGLCRTGGRMGILIGGTQVERARELAPGVDWVDPVAIPQSRDRVLLTGRKRA